jgi:hypothetical protein
MIGEKGATSLAKVLGSLRSLHTLECGYNERMSGLHALSFKDNAITNVGAEDLVQSLLYLKTLRFPHDWG